jgi:uncharacterized membrane protein YsdA (DUF1294 family)
MGLLTLLPLYFTLVVVMSAITFVAYGYDKRQARNDGRRVSEKRLHLMAFLGGWPGAVLGQRYFRHKTQKLSFRVAFWLVVALHLTLLALLLSWW